MSYPATATLSVLADQFSVTDAGALVATRPAGTEGAVRSTIHSATAGVGALMPLAVEKTEKVWFALDRPVYAFGLMQPPALPPSSLQVKEAPAPVEWKV